MAAPKRTIHYMPGWGTPGGDGNDRRVIPVPFKPSKAALFEVDLMAQAM